MRNYLDLAQKILDKGSDRMDRTGVGCRSLFGEQLRFDLSQGFPLLTTKRVFWRGVAAELLWMLSGNTNVKPLQEQAVHIWDEWCDQHGNLGPVYGHMWRNYGLKPESVPQPTPTPAPNPTFLGIANGSGKDFSLIGKTWQGMIERCYNPANIGYEDYGQKGAHVCDRWLNFKCFEHDAKLLPGWTNKELHPRKYVLDKDGLGDGFCYSPKTCQWITAEQNSQLRSNRTFILEKDGVQVSFRNPSQFCRERGLRVAYLTSLWRHPNPADRVYGYRLVSVLKDRGIDQIDILIQGLKRDPGGRRHIVCSWHHPSIKYQKLPPCHNYFQCFVANNKLSLCLHQRSADFLLGVPFNIASYALLTHMIAHVCGYQVGEFIHNFGDVHLYHNHFDQIREQLSRTPCPLPQLSLNREVDSIFDFKFEDFKLTGYTPMPAIKAEVAV